MKRIIVLVFVFFIASSLNAQISNNFIKKGKVVVYPRFAFYKKLNYGRIGCEIGYMPVNKFELKTGLLYNFGAYSVANVNIGMRYYLLKSRFTLFPELNYYPSYSFSDKKYVQFYDIGFGAGYYGIFRRIGIDLMAKYYIGEYNFIYPDLKIKILLGKIDD